MPHFSEFDTAFRFPYIDSHIDISLSEQLCCGIFFRAHMRSSEYLRTGISVWSGGLCLIDGPLGRKNTYLFIYHLLVETKRQHMWDVSKCIYNCLLFLFPLSPSSPLFSVSVSAFVLCSRSPHLSSLSSRGHGSFTGLSLSFSTTPKAETTSSSCFCTSHSEFILFYTSLRFKRCFCLLVSCWNPYFHNPKI